MQLLLRHYDPARHPVFAHANWAERAGAWDRVFTELSGGHASAEAQCMLRDCGSRWTVSVDRARFQRLDRLRLLTEQELPGQAHHSSRPRWAAEPTEVFWLSDPVEVLAMARPVERATVALPGAYARLLEETVPGLLQEVALHRCWTRRGRAESLEIVSDDVGLITLSAVLYFPGRRDPDRLWTAAERRGLHQAGDRIREALHVLTREL